MLVVISPAKKLNENCNKDIISNVTIPSFLEDSKKLLILLENIQLINYLNL